MEPADIEQLIKAGFADPVVRVFSDDNTHFEAVVVAAEFDGIRPLARHQLVYNAPNDPRVGQRRTLLLEDWLARDCLRKNGCRDADLKNLAIVRGLLDY